MTCQMDSRLSARRYILRISVKWCLSEMILLRQSVDLRVGSAELYYVTVDFLMVPSVQVSSSNTLTVAVTVTVTGLGAVTHTKRH